MLFRLVDRVPPLTGLGAISNIRFYKHFAPTELPQPLIAAPDILVFWL